MENKKQGEQKLTIRDVFLVLVLLIIACVIVYFFIKGTGNFIIKVVEKISNIASNMDSVVIVAIITGGISIVTVIISSVISKIIEYKQITKWYLYEKRKEPYHKFISMIYKLQTYEKLGKDYTQQEMFADICEFSQDLTLWGSSKVIKKWLKFRETSQQGEKGIQNLFVLEDIVFEIRKDMGQKKKGLKQGDLLSFFVNDIKDYLPTKIQQ